MKQKSDSNFGVTCDVLNFDSVSDLTPQYVLTFDPEVFLPTGFRLCFDSRANLKTQLQLHDDTGVITEI